MSGPGPVIEGTCLSSLSSTFGMQQLAEPGLGVATAAATTAAAAATTAAAAATAAAAVLSEQALASPYHEPAAFEPSSHPDENYQAANVEDPLTNPLAAESEAEIKDTQQQSASLLQVREPAATESAPSQQTAALPSAETQHELYQETAGKKTSNQTSQLSDVHQTPRQVPSNEEETITSPGSTPMTTSHSTQIANGMSWPDPSADQGLHHEDVGSQSAVAGQTAEAPVQPSQSAEQQRACPEVVSAEACEYLPFEQPSDIAPNSCATVPRRRTERSQRNLYGRYKPALDQCTCNGDTNVEVCVMHQPRTRSNMEQRIWRSVVSDMED